MKEKTGRYYIIILSIVTPINMMKENVILFLRIVAQTPSLQKTIKAATQQKGIALIAAECGYSFTTEELRSVLKEQPSELSDEQLDAVADGFFSKRDIECCLNLFAS